MKTLTFMLSLLSGLLAFPSYAQENQLTEAEKKEGWQLLFNGKDIGQWRNYQQPTVSPLWQIDDGAIKMSAAGAGDILTKEKYQNFDLKLEWKISEGGNSGVFILADEEGKYIYTHAPEIQILDNEKAHDNKIDSHLAGSLYDMVAVHQSALKPAGEWNQLRIKLDDKLLQVWQNGVITTNIVIGSSTWDTLVANSKFADWKGFGENTSGHIGLQDHGNQVWFKNIKIRELE